MKLKKMSIFIVFIMTALSLCILPAMAYAAEYDCRVCTITAAGIFPGVSFSTDGFYVQVEDAAGAWTGSRTFYLDDSLGKAGWATVLTAFSLGKSLRMTVVDTTARFIDYHLAYY